MSKQTPEHDSQSGSIPKICAGLYYSVANKIVEAFPSEVEEQLYDDFDSLGEHLEDIFASGGIFTEQGVRVLDKRGYPAIYSENLQMRLNEAVGNKILPVKLNVGKYHSILDKYLTISDQISDDDFLLLFPPGIGTQLRVSIGAQGYANVDFLRDGEYPNVSRDGLFLRFKKIITKNLLLEMSKSRLGNLWEEHSKLARKYIRASLLRRAVQNHAERELPIDDFRRDRYIGSKGPMELAEKAEEPHRIKLK